MFLKKHPKIRIQRGTPYSMNRLVSEFFKEFSGVILEVCETMGWSFWRHVVRIVKEKRQKNYSKNMKNLQKPCFLLF